jgi:hypothetical protein
MENKTICGLQVNYRNYFITDQKTLDNGLIFYSLEFNTNPFTLTMDKHNFELLDQNQKVIDVGTNNQIRWLTNDISPGIQ